MKVKKLSDQSYIQAVDVARKGVELALRDTRIADLVTKARIESKECLQKGLSWETSPAIKAAGRVLMKAQYDAFQKANPPGVGTWLGFNYYDLRGPAYFIFPLLTPFIQMIPKRGKVNAGVGTVAHWKATRNPNSTFIYAGVAEGQRNATATPNEIDYLATYKELGMEGGQTFTAQWAGEGYTDNLADEHFRNLARLRLQEEMMTLLGNSGTAAGNLGYALGQAPNVTAALATSDTFNSPATTGLAANTNVSATVIALTGMGINPGGQAGYGAPPTVASGITPTSTRTNVDGTTLTVAGGTSAISNVSNAVITNSTAKWVKLSCAAVKGAVAYAWFVSTTNTSTAADSVANCLLAAITNAPVYTVGAVAAGTQRGNAAGLSTDNSFQATDFDGLFTYAFQNGFWTDMAHGSFTPVGNGQVLEVEADLQNLWNAYQAQPDAIWCSADVRAALESAIVFSTSGTNSFVFPYGKDGQFEGLLGGFIVSAYKSKYSINATGGAGIPIRIHPMLPSGTMLYDINTNPYPHSRIPAVREFMVQRDYYAIEWPVVTREWTFGTYVQEVLAHYLPWITAIRTGIGPFVAPCWIAAEVFGEDFFTGYKTNIVRNYLLNWENTSGLGKIVVGAYRLVGKQVAEATRKSSLLKKFFTSVFNGVLRKAEASA